MKKKIKYTDELMEFEVIKDFLPLPQKLATRTNNVKVTIALNEKSVDFFKTQAKKYHSKYQQMIRNLLDAYVTHFVH